MEKAEDFDVAREGLSVQLLAQIVKVLLQTARLVLRFVVAITILGWFDQNSRLVANEHLSTECVNESMHFLISSCGPTPADLLQVSEIETRYHSCVVQGLLQLPFDTPNALIFLRTAEIYPIVASQNGHSYFLAQELVMSLILLLLRRLISFILLSQRLFAFFNSRLRLRSFFFFLLLLHYLVNLLLELSGT